MSISPSTERVYDIFEDAISSWVEPLREGDKKL